MRSDQPALVGEAAGVPAALVAVVADPEAEVQPVGSVAELDQDVPDGERVLAAADGDEHPVVGRQHVVIGDRLLDLAPAQLQEVLATEVGVVPWKIDDRRLPAHPALGRDGRHFSPPR